MDPLLQENIDAILDASNEGIWDWDITSSDIYYSESIYRFLGRDEGATMKNMFAEPEALIYHEDLQSFQDSLTEAIDNPDCEHYAIDCRAVCLDGAICWLRIRGVIVRAGTQAIRMVGTMIDISVRRNQELDLERKRSMLEMVVNNVPVLMYFKDRYSRYRIVNEKMCEWLGCSGMEEVIGKDDSNFYSEETAHEIHQDELYVIESSRPILDKIRRERWSNKPDSFIKEVKYPWLDREGQVIGTFGAATDVTRLMKLQSRLRSVALDLQSKAKAYKEELDMARELQQAILPRNDGFWEKRVECLSDYAKIDSSYQSAKDLAGDYYELLPLSEGKLGVFICDVSGIGVRSAFIVSMIRGLIEKANRVASDPAAFLERINRGLHNLLGETVMKLPTTASYTVIDFIDGKATIASAEADFPIILNQACDGVIEINEDEVSTGCALGSHLECEYSNHLLDLDKIGMFLFSTDGAVSRTNIEGEEIGRELLQDLTIRYSDVDEPCAQLGIEILEWGSGHKLEDDVCLISVRSIK